MKKNLKSCIEQPIYSEPKCLLDMNQYEMITENGLVPDLKHKKNAHLSAAWHFANSTQARIEPALSDLSAYRYLTFSAYAVQGEGGSFYLRFESDQTPKGESGYGILLPIARNGWNDYRIELPFLQARREVCGWDHIRAIVLDCAVGGQANSTQTVLSLDNFYLWEELAPHLYARSPELKGAAVFSKTAAYAIVNRRRLPIAPDADPDARPFETNGILWLPMAPVAAALAHKAVVDNKSETLSFTYRRQKYVFYGNSDRYLQGGAEDRLPFRPMVRAGTLFFPADYLRQFFHWRQSFTDPTGLVVLSNRKNIFESRRDEAMLWQLNAEMTFVQPSGEEILADLHKKIPNPDKGRLLLLSEEWMTLRRAAKTDASKQAMLSALKADFGKASEAYLASPILSDGVPEGLALPDALALASNRICNFAALYRMTGEKHYAERTAAELEALARLSDWDAQHSMLTAANTALSAALGYDWCHAVWSEGRKALIERALLRYALRPGVDAYLGKGRMWKSGTAASAQINCGLTAAALALSDIYPETSLRILRHSLRNVIPCFEAYSPDGGYAESLAAWESGTRALVLLIAMLQSACGKDYGLSRAPGFAATGMFSVMAETAHGAWNYHDCKAVPLDTAVLGWFAGRYKKPELLWLRRRDLAAGKKPMNLLDLIFDSEVDSTLLPELPLDAVYRKAGLAMLRAGWGAEDAFFALHGGSNHIFGGELDAGSILLEMGGERFLVETGGEEALPALLRKRAEGQNTVVIDPPADERLPDQNPDAVASLLQARSAEGQAFAVVDMTGTNDAIVRGKRGILLTDARRMAVVQDEMVFDRPVTVTWRAYTQAKAEYIGSRTLVLEQNGKRLLCKLSGAGAAKFAILPIEGSALSCIAVVAEAKEKLRMAVAFKLFGENDRRADSIYECKSMASWEL